MHGAPLRAATDELERALELVRGIPFEELTHVDTAGRSQSNSASSARSSTRPTSSAAGV